MQRTTSEEYEGGDVTHASAFVLRKRVMVTLLTYFENAYELLGTKIDTRVRSTLLDSRRAADYPRGVRRWESDPCLRIRSM